MLSKLLSYLEGFTIKSGPYIPDDITRFNTSENKLCGEEKEYNVTKDTDDVYPNDDTDDVYPNDDTDDVYPNDDTDDVYPNDDTDDVILPIEEFEKDIPNNLCKLLPDHLRSTVIPFLKEFVKNEITLKECYPSYEECIYYIASLFIDDDDWKPGKRDFFLKIFMKDNKIWFYKPFIIKRVTMYMEGRFNDNMDLS